MTALDDPGTAFALVTIFGLTGAYLVFATVSEQSEKGWLRIFYFVFGLMVFALAIFMLGVKPNIISVRSLATIFAFTGLYLIHGMVKNKNDYPFTRVAYFLIALLMFGVAIGMRGSPIQ